MENAQRRQAIQDIIDAEKETLASATDEKSKHLSRISIEYWEAVLAGDLSDPIISFS